MNARGIALPLLAVATAGGMAIAAGPRPPDPVIARVDQIPINLSLAHARVAGVSTIHGSDLSVVLGPDWRDKVLQSLVDDVIVQREAGRIGAYLNADEVARAEAHTRGQFTTRAQFSSWLKERGMDEQELFRRLRLQLLSQRVYDRVTKDVKATDDEVVAYYGQHTSDYAGIDGKPLPLEDVRDQVEPTVTQKMKDAAFGTWLDGWRKKAKVVVLIRDWS